MTELPRTISGDFANPPSALAGMISESRWVLWRWEPKGADDNGNQKWTKVPYQADYPSRQAKSNDPKTWGSWRDAVKAVLAGKAHGLGYVLTNGDIGALDLDHCRDGETGEIAPWGQEILDRAPDAYTEITVSGAGLRVVGKITSSVPDKQFKVNGVGNGARIEVYRGGSGRFITVSCKELAHCNVLPNIDALLEAIVAEREAIKGAERAANSNAVPNGFIFDRVDGDDEIDRIRDALGFINADDRDQWLSCGMALRSHLGDRGRELWDAWSQKSDKYDRKDQDKTWRSFKRDGIGIGTLFHLAQQAGWRGFSGVEDLRFDDRAAGPRAGSLIKTSKQFVANFVPPDYLVDGLLQEGFLYSLTGATGAGKTAITLRLAASVALGVVFAGRETKRRRVLYLAAENPDDVRMRWIALSQYMVFDVEEIEVFFVEGVFKISQAKDRLKEEAAKLGGDFGMVIIDTGPVFYEGDEENNRTQQGRHAEMLRELISVIPGKPAVIANCHPVKNAAPDNLVPAGGGNFLNQVDGNLTAAKTDSTTELHTQGKFRGVEFAPTHFLIKTVTHQDVRDSKNRLIPTVICEWISDKEKESLAAQKVSDEDAILRLIADDAKASQATLAVKMGWKLHSGEPNKMRAGRCIKALTKHKLIKETRRGNYRLTPEGETVLKTPNQET